MITASVARAEERFGRIDVLVNNAGYAEPGTAEEVTPEKLREQFEVNVFGPWRLVQAVLPDMRRRRTGRIIQVSSLAGQIGAAGMAAYTASKHALEGFSASLSAELTPLGITVTILQPGSTDTGFRTVWGDRNSAGTIADYQPVYEQLDRLLDNRPATTPDDVAAAIMSVSTVDDAPLRVPVGEHDAAIIRAAREAQLSDLGRSAAILAP